MLWQLKIPFEPIEIRDVLGLVPDRENLVRKSIDRDYGGLAQDDSLALDINERGRGSQVDSNVVGKKPQQLVDIYD